jgi:ATP-dependent DNA ligase
LARRAKRAPIATPDASKGTQKSAGSATASGKTSGGFTDEELAAMKERIREQKAAARRGPRGDGESDVLAKIAEMPEPDRVMAERIAD